MERGDPLAYLRPERDQMSKRPGSSGLLRSSSACSRRQPQLPQRLSTWRSATPTPPESERVCSTKNRRAANEPRRLRAEGRCGEGLHAQLPGIQRREDDRSERKQLGTFSSTTSLVTITIGGDDAGFSNVIIDCALYYFTCGSAIGEANAFIAKKLPALLETTYKDSARRRPRRRSSCSAIQSCSPKKARRATSASSPRATRKKSTQSAEETRRDHEGARPKQ